MFLKKCKRYYKYYCLGFEPLKITTNACESVENKPFEKDTLEIIIVVGEEHVKLDLKTSIFSSRR